MDTETGIISGIPTVINENGIDAVVTVTAENGAVGFFDATFVVSKAKLETHIISVILEEDEHPYYEGDNYPDINDVLTSEVDGTLEWVEDGVLKAGDNELEYVFTPEDETYDILKGTVNIEALPVIKVATVTTTLSGIYGEEFSGDISDFVLNEDEVEGVTYDIDVLPEGLSFDTKTGSITGVPTVIYVDGLDAVVTATAGNGSVVEFPVTFVIAIAEVDITDLSGDSSYYVGDPVPDVDDVLKADTEGTLTWVDAPEVLPSGEVTLTYQFTPDDTVNYGSVTGSVVLTVLDKVSVASETITLSYEYGDTVSEDLSKNVENADSVGGVSYDVNVLPNGLTLDSETGVISGSPTAIYPDGLNATVVVTAENGSTANINLKVVVAKADPEIEVSEDILNKDYYEGDNLPNIDDILSSEIDGTFEWVDPDATLQAGENELDWVFTPADTDHYDVVTGTTTIVANAKIHLATATTMYGTYGANFSADLSNFVLNAEDVDGVSYDTNVLPRGLELDAKTGKISGVPTAVYADGFDLTATFEAGNGDVETLDLVIVIWKAMPEVFVTGNVDSGYTEGDEVPNVNDILSSDTDGTLTWTVAPDNLNAGVNDLQWQFVPDDTDHYSTVSGAVTIEAEKKVTTTTTASTTTTSSTTAKSTTTTTKSTTSTAEPTTTTTTSTTVATTSTVRSTTSTTTTEETTTTTNSTTPESTTTTTTETTTTTTTETTTTTTQPTTTTTETTTTTTTTTTTEATTTTELTTTTTETTTTTDTTTTTEMTTTTTTEESITDTSISTTETSTSTTSRTTNTSDTTGTSVTGTTSVTTTDFTVMKGDADVDGEITINDAYLILVYYAHQMAGSDYAFRPNDPELEAKILVAIDVDEDSVYTINDAYLTLVYYARKMAGIEVTWDQLLSGKDLIYNK